MKYKDKLFIAVTDANGHDYCTHIKISFGFSKGGINPLTDTEVRRGYFLYIQPVEKKDGIESTVLTSGIRMRIREATRRSPKFERDFSADEQFIKRNLKLYLDDTGIKVDEKWSKE